MSWLKPENFPPSDYDPQQVVREMMEKHGKLSRSILDAFNNIDPLHVFYGENVDEYHGYVERFMSQLGAGDLTSFSDDEIKSFVSSSFHQSQVDQGFVTPENISQLAKEIMAVRDARLA